MIDSHCHLDRFSHPPLEEWFGRGLKGIVAPAVDMDSLQKLLALKARWPGRIWVAAGVHPEGAPSQSEVRAMVRWIDDHHQEICAIGEVGLPHYSLNPGETVPPSAFAALDLFLDRAVRWDLPLILHAVHEGAEPCLERLLDKGVRRAVFHWLKAPQPVIRRILSAGYFVSVTPEVLTLERDQSLAELAFPGQLLLETDGPEPLRGVAGTCPLLIRESIRFLAERFGWTLEALEARLDHNAKVLFSL